MDSELVFRLGCHSGKYLWANEDGSSVQQEQNGSSQNAHWTVESLSNNSIRLRSCYGKYLTASGEPVENSLAEFKVIQTNRDDQTVSWEISESSPNKVMIKTLSYPWQYLTANSSPNNSVTHMEIGSGNVWWELEFVKKIPQPHAAVASQSFPAQTSRSSEPSQAQGSNVATWLSGASSAANLAFTGYKFSNALSQLQEPPAVPHVPVEPAVPTPDDSSESMLDIIGEIFSGIFG